MEIGLREWLIVGALVVIVLIVVDGWRRMRAQSNSLKIDIDDKLSDLGENNYNPELPLGEARVFVPNENDAVTTTKSARNTDSESVFKSQERLDQTTPHQQPTPPVESPSANNRLAQEHSSTQEKKPAPRSEVFSTSKSSAIDERSFEAKKEVLVTDELAITDLEETQQLMGSSKLSSVIDTYPKSGFSAFDEITPEVNRPKRIDHEILSYVDSQQSDNQAMAESQLGFSAVDAPKEFEVPAILKKDHLSQSKIERASAQPRQETNQSLPEHVKQHSDPIDQRKESKKGFELEDDSNNVDHLAQGLLAHSSDRVEPPNHLQHDDTNLTDSDRTNQEPTNSRAELALDTPVINTEVKHIETTHSGRDLRPDKFEELLAERAQEEVDENPDDLGSLDISEKAMFAKEQEIAALKAMLEQLSAEDKLPEYRGLDNNTETDDAQRVNQLDGFLETDVIKSDSQAGTYPIGLTIVVDDDLDLKDIDEPIAKLADTSQIDKITEQLETNLSDKQELAVKKVNLLESQVSLDSDADPLMDGFDDSKAAEALVEQFEQDLKVAHQAVANELDRPISEILKNKKDSRILENTAASSQSEQREIEDPLSDQKRVSEDLLSQIDHEEKTLGNNLELESNTQRTLDDTVAENYPLEHKSADLGFTALEQSFDDDPLMEGFDDDPLMEGFDDGAESENIDDLDNLDLVADDVKENLMTSQSEQKYDALNQSASGSGRLKNKKTRKPIANVDDPNAVLIVTVVAKDQYLNGAALKRVVLACGMEFGDMQVFHRFEDGLDTGAVQFSMANAINPGTFDFDTMDHAATPGVSFFMSMDEPLDPKNALECMMATAETVATHLNGDLLDDDRSVIRPQTKEHYRERVRIHEMNKLTRRAL